METSPINSIKIGRRFRKDLGDIDALAKNIKQIGLLYPIIINPQNELIIGLRRLIACKSLGWEKIPVKVINAGGENDQGRSDTDTT